jgi:hypothetical protein
MKREDDTVFTCWKEIAAHLGKGVRTVQRWERQFGLPVQRPNAHCKGIVRASREELDKWMQTEWSRRAMDTRKPDLAKLREGPIVKSITNLRNLRESNRELLKEFKDCLRVLNRNCEELWVIVRQKEEDGEQKSSAA